jgi:hypothetical protein
MRVFIGGIIQGSKHGQEIHSQDYRTRIKEALEEHVSDAVIHCQFELHPESVNYPASEGRLVFFQGVAQASVCDVVIAYLPEASMGTAIEMWEAQQAGKIVFSISPMGTNWVINYLSRRVFTDIESFLEFIRSGEFLAAVTEELSEEK